jgi:hypothetical protein
MHLNEFLHEFGFIVLALLLGLSGLIAAFARLRTRDRSLAAKRSFLDYILVWPLLFSKSSNGNGPRRDSRRLTTRELMGWLFVLILIVLAITFKW